MVEREEERLQVELREVLLPREERRGRKLVLQEDCRRLLRVKHLLVLGKGHITEGSLQELQRLSVLVLLPLLGVIPRTGGRHGRLCLGGISTGQASREEVFMEAAAAQRRERSGLGATCQWVL